MSIDNLISGSGVYGIINYTAGTAYIGSAVRFSKRWNEHKNKLRKNIHENKKLQNSWNKYGEESFDFTILEMVEDKSKLLNVEQEWLDKTIPARHKVLNIMFTACGTYGMRHSEETKKQMSISRKGRKKPPFTAEHCQKLSLAKKGKKLPPQTLEDRKKKSIALKGNKNAVGATRSAETRARMSIAQKLRFSK